MAILFGLTSCIVYVENTIELFVKYKYLRPNIKSFEKSKIRSISNVGIKFFIIQVSCMLLYTVDNMLITYYFGAEEVTPFHIVYKAFNMVFSVLSALTVPYWSRTTEAIASGDITWVRKTVKKIRVIYSFFAIAYICLAIIFKPLAKLWMGRELIYQPGLIEIMCISIKNALCIYSISGKGNKNSSSALPRKSNPGGITRYAYFLTHDSFSSICDIYCPTNIFAFFIDNNPA